MLSIANLRTLVTVIDTGGVRPAALRLGRTPSAISMALKQLEATIGAPLFESDRKTHPTPACLQIIEKARELLDHYDTTSTTITSIAQNEAHRCTIACIASFATAILPAALQRLKHASRVPEIRIREANTSAIFEQIADGKADLGFARVTSQRSDIKTTTLLRDSYVLVCRHNDPLVGAGVPVSWEALSDRDFIVNDSLQDIDSAEAARDVWNLDFVKGARFHTSSVASTFALVNSNAGIALMPGLCLAEAPDELRFLPLEDTRIGRVVSMLTKKGRRLSPASERVVRSVRYVVQQYARNLNYNLLDVGR